LVLLYSVLVLVYSAGRHILYFIAGALSLRLDVALHKLPASSATRSELSNDVSPGPAYEVSYASLLIPHSSFRIPLF